MPLYDCVLLLKPHLPKDAVIEVAARIGRDVYMKKGIVTAIKSFGTVQLGYGIKKLDGRFYQGRMIQLTMMATPMINKELHYLNREDRLLRWLLVKHRDTKYGLDFLTEEEEKRELSRLPRSSIFDDEDADRDDDDDDEYEVDQEEKKEE